VFRVLLTTVYGKLILWWRCVTSNTTLLLYVVRRAYARADYAATVYLGVFRIPQTSNGNRTTQPSKLKQFNLASFNLASFNLASFNLALLRLIFASFNLALLRFAFAFHLSSFADNQLSFLISLFRPMIPANISRKNFPRIYPSVDDNSLSLSHKINMLTV
jgi:hypothetical protein